MKGSSSKAWSSREGNRVYKALKGSGAALAAPEPASREGTGALGPASRDALQVLAGAGNRVAKQQHVPLVRLLVPGLRPDRVHLVHELVVPTPEIALAALQDVELGAGFQIFDQTVTVRRLGLRDSVSENLHAEIVAPGLILRRLAPALGKGCSEGLGAWGIDGVVPYGGPDPGKGIRPCAPGGGGVEAAAGERVV